MKKLILIIITAMFFFACEKEQPLEVKSYYDIIRCYQQKECITIGVWNICYPVSLTLEYAGKYKPCDTFEITDQNGVYIAYGYTVGNKIVLESVENEDNFPVLATCNVWEISCAGYTFTPN